MSISIVVCTFNKSQKLGNLLDKLSRVIVPEEQVVVVDNGSKDDTGVVCRIWEKRFNASGLNLTCVCEPIVGLSVARNTGTRVAAGTHLLFLDDDCLPVASMVHEYREALKTYPACVLAAGPIEPLWGDEGPPDWLSEKFYWVFGQIRYGGQEVRPLGKAETINGGNFLVEKDMLEQIGGFNPELGHQGHAFRGSEEQEMLVRLQRATHRTMLAVPQAKAWHDFPRDRLSTAYVRQRVEGASRDRAMAERMSFRYLIMFARSGYYAVMLMITQNEIARAQYRGYITGVLSAIHPDRNE